MELDLGHDAVLLCHAGDGEDLAAARRQIERSGFGTRLARPEDLAPVRRQPPATPVPRPVAAALPAAREAGALVVVEFHASWCGPCKTVERDIMPHPAVQRALRDFRVVRVDVDVHPEAGRHYAVDAMPTLLVLDGEGREMRRFVGVMEPARLAAELARLREGASPPPE